MTMPHETQAPSADLTVDEKLRVVQGAEAEISWEDTGREKILRVTLPFDCGFDAAGKVDDEGKLVGNVYAGLLEVPDELRRHGIGERLIGTVGEAAASRGATTLVSHIENQSSLRIMARVFGADAVHVFATDPETREIREISLAEVIEFMGPETVDARVDGARSVNAEIDLTTLAVYRSTATIQ